MDARKDRIGEHAAEPPPALGHRRARPGPRPPAGPARLAETGRRHRRLAGTVRLRPPRRPDRPRTRRGRPRRPGRLARGPGRPRPGRRPRRARHARRQAAAPARHLPGRDRLGPPYVGDELRQVRAAAWDARLAGLRAAADARAAEQRGDHDHAATRHVLAASYQALEQAYRQREAVFAAVMADRADWDQPPPAPSASWPSPPTPNCAAATPASTSRRCARPNPSPPPRPSATSSPSPRTSRPARWTSGSPTWPPGTGPSPTRLADRQSQTIPSEDPDYGDLGRGVPRLDRPGQGPDLAAAQARDPALPADPPARDGPRRRLGSRRLTAAAWYHRGVRGRRPELVRAGLRTWRDIARGYALREAHDRPCTPR